MRGVRVSQDEADALGMGNHPGYNGMFTRKAHPDALPNGTCISKVNSEAGDVTPNGTSGTIMGSVGCHELGIMYFIEWDNKPGYVIGCVEKKVAVP